MYEKPPARHLLLFLPPSFFFVIIFFCVYCLFIWFLNFGKRCENLRKTDDNHAEIIVIIINVIIDKNDVDLTLNILITVILCKMGNCSTTKIYFLHNFSRHSLTKINVCVYLYNNYLKPNGVYVCVCRVIYFFFILKYSRTKYTKIAYEFS